MSHTPISLEALQALDAIARKGSFAAAAQSLHRVPSALTYTIKKLEEQLGVGLFDRTGHRAQLTEAGDMVLERGRSLLEAAEELTQRAQQMADGYEPQIGIAIDSLFDTRRLFPLIREFQFYFPQINLRVHEEVLGGGIETLVQGRADLLIGSSLNVPVTGCARRELGTLEMVLVCAADHPLAGREDAVDEPTLRQYVAAVTADSARQQAPLSVGLLDRQPRLTLPGIHCRIEAQVAGLGVGWLPRHRVQHLLAEEKLVELRSEVPRPGPQTSVIWRTPLRGKGMYWWVEQMHSAGLFERLIGAEPTAGR